MSEVAPPAHDERLEALREGTTMALYVSITLLAALAALPAGDEGSGADGGAEGVHGLRLVGLVWGTAVGLALAHWFSFRVVAKGFGGGSATRRDALVGGAQVAGAAAVALLCTIPILLTSEDNDVEVTAFVPALVIGLGAYGASRLGGRRPRVALALAAGSIVAGLAVAAVKNVLAGH
jgi:hypothetical protein